MSSSLAINPAFVHPIFPSARTATDPLVHRGRHFGRAVYPFCSVKVLITNGLLRVAEDDPAKPETIPSVFASAQVQQLIVVFSESREVKIISDMLNTCPGLLDRLLSASEEEVEFIADLVRTGRATSYHH